MTCATIDTRQYLLSRGLDSARRDALLTARRLLAFAIVDRDRGVRELAERHFAAAKRCITGAEPS